MTSMRGTRQGGIDSFLFGNGSAAFKNCHVVNVTDGAGIRIVEDHNAYI